jgi:hypothetical protein
MGCITQATIFNVCLSDSDLRDLDAWEEAPNRLGFSPAVWSRACLHKRTQQDAELASRVADRLDLHFVDTILLIRCMELEGLTELVDLWVRGRQGAALPGLLWALCTDARPEVYSLGGRLCHEASRVALDSLVNSTGSENRASSRS